MVRKSRVKKGDMLNFESPHSMESDLTITVEKFYPGNKIVDVNGNVYYIDDLKRKYAKFSVMR